METVTLSRDEINSAIENKETILTCRGGNEYKIIISDGNKNELQFVDESGLPIESEPFDLKINIDGVEEVFTSDSKGKVLYNAPEESQSIGIMFTTEVLELLTEKLSSDPPENEIAEDDHVKKIYLTEKLTKEETTLTLVDNKPIKLVIKTYIVLARMKGMHFDSDKCFMLPSAIPAIRSLVNLYNDNPDTVLLLTGHTDTTGKNDYNDTLSLERADAIASYLTDSVDAWLNWYDDRKPNQKKWGAKEDALMLSVVLEGEKDQSVKNFQIWHNKKIDEEGDSEPQLEVDGVIGPKTRKALITRYMKQDNTSLPEDIELQTHGCGENFPLDDSESEIDKKPQNNKNDATDRRVEMFFFGKNPGIIPEPQGKISPAGSTEYLQWRKRARVVEVDSPTKDTLTIYLLDDNFNPVPSGTPYKIKINGAVREGVVASSGLVIESGLLLDGISEATVEWGEVNDWEYEYPERESRN